ncbi:MAG: hypothetical protein WCH34_11390 [Bacteroidota bacterium]
MEKEQQVEMTRNLNLKTELANSATIYVNNPAMVTAAADFNTAIDLNLQAAAATKPDNSGYSKEKNDYKKFLSKIAANLSWKAYVKLNKLGKTGIANTLSINPTDFSTLADSEFTAFCQKAHDIMLANVNDLKPDYVTEAMLTAFQTKINTFSGLQGTSDLVHEGSPLLTDNFVESFKPVRLAVEDVKLMVRDFNDPDYQYYNPDFYKRVMKACEIPTANVHHTYVNIVATNKSTNQAIEGILFGLESAKKSGTTDWEGKVSISEVKAGKDVLTGTLNGIVVYTEHIAIKRGRSNDFNLQLTIESA